MASKISVKLFPTLSMLILLAGCSSPSSDIWATSPGVEAISVEVYGEVLRPQEYLLTGGSSALDAVRDKAGLTAFSFIREVRVERSGGHGHGGKTYAVNLRRAMKNRKYDLFLKDGDRVFVPRGQWFYEDRPKELRDCPVHRGTTQ